MIRLLIGLYSLTLVILAIANKYWYDEIAARISLHFSDLDDIRVYLYSAGFTLLGIVSLALAVFLFALKILFEQLPHRLFVKIGSDFWIVFLTLIAYICAVGILVAAVVVDCKNILLSVILSFWPFFLFPLYAVYVFRRIFLIIDPERQIIKIYKMLHIELTVINWIADLFFWSNTVDSQGNIQFDRKRNAFLNKREQLQQNLSESLSYLILFAQQMNEKGDYDNTIVAYDNIEKIHSDFIQCKKRTFETAPSYNENIIKSIKGYLGSVAQYIEKKNEYAMYLCMRSLANLSLIYTAIDYPDDNKIKHHSHYAAHELVRISTDIDFRLMRESGLNSISILGTLSIELIKAKLSNQIIYILEEIGRITRQGAQNYSSLELMRGGMQQLAMIEYHLMFDTHPRTRHRLQIVHDFVYEAAEASLNHQQFNVDRINNHDYYLAPYFIDDQNNVLQAIKIIAEQNDQAKTKLMRNVIVWSNYSLRKFTLLFNQAINNKSHFSINMIYWVSKVSFQLFQLSNSVGTSTEDSQIQNELRESALMYLNLISIITRETNTVAGKEQVQFMYSNDLIGHLCVIAINAIINDHYHFSRLVIQRLFSWVVYAGRHEETQDVMARGLFAFSVFASLVVDEYVSEIDSIADITRQMPHEVRSYISRKLNEYASDPAQHYGIVSGLADANIVINQQALSSLLNRIAGILDDTQNA